MTWSTWYRKSPRKQLKTSNVEFTAHPLLCSEHLTCFEVCGVSIFHTCLGTQTRTGKERAKVRRAKVRRASKSHLTVGCLQVSRQRLRSRPHTQMFSWKNHCDFISVCFAIHMLHCWRAGCSSTFSRSSISQTQHKCSWPCCSNQLCWSWDLMAVIFLPTKFEIVFQFRTYYCFAIDDDSVPGSTVHLVSTERRHTHCCF